MDFSNTQFSLKRPLTSYNKVRNLIGSILRNRSFQAGLKRAAQTEYLNLGCGPNTRSDFINLDYSWHPSIDVCWDLTRGVPFASNSMQGIFTEHCLEHLTFAAVDQVLAECRRVLKPGGTLRIVVPDGQLYLTSYVRCIEGEKDIKLPYAEDDEYRGIYSPIMSVNRIFREFGHLFIFDFDAFRQLLTKNGFVNISKESFGAGRDQKLLLDSESRDIESLYVEASVPSG
jgi:predicted SAM-dependent methyltransferase